MTAGTVLNTNDAVRDVVVVGASAGGMEPLMELLARLPASMPAAIAVVVHLNPRIESRLGPILARRAAITVVTAEDLAPFKKSHVYVAIPDRHLLLDHGTVRLGRGPREHFTRPAIDALFRSAATEYGARTVGVVLSGASNDGVAGLIAIHDAGGITLVQSPIEAAFPRLPRSAIIGDHVDAALPIADLAAALTDLASGQPVTRG